MPPTKAAPRSPALEAALAAFVEQLSLFVTNLQRYLGQPITPPPPYTPTQPSTHHPSLSSVPPPPAPPPTLTCVTQPSLSSVILEPDSTRVPPLAPPAFPQQLAAIFAPHMTLPPSPVPQELLLHEPVGCVPSQDEPPPEPPDIDAWQQLTSGNPKLSPGLANKSPVYGGGIDAVDAAQVVQHPYLLN